MPSPREIPPGFLSRARSGQLARRNTAPGTPERSAVDRVTYLRRASRRDPGETVRARLGHEPAATERAMPAMLDDPPRWVEFDDLSRAEARRIGRYLNLARQFSYGRDTPSDFRRHVSSWRPIRGERFLADPDAVLAILETRRVEDQEIFYYRRGRQP